MSANNLHKVHKPQKPLCYTQKEGNRCIIRYEWIFLILILLFVVIIRTRLLDFPLERDEGEYAYLGQLIQQGIPPYSMAYNMKFPGTYFMYALMMSLFGQTSQGIHLGLMAVNAITIALIYKTGTKIFNSFVGIIACCSYAFLSLSPSVLGFAGHATHFVVLWAMGGLLALLYAFDNNKLYLYFVSGALFSLAFIMKQPGVFFIGFGVAYIIVHHFQDRSLSHKMTLLNLGMFLIGTLSLLTAMVVYLYASGILEKFWFFTVLYSAKYVTQIPLSKAANFFLLSFPRVVDGFFLIWAFAVLGFITLFLHPDLKDKRIAISLFVVLSFLTVCPGFYFREHYFITFLPAVSLLAGLFIDYLYQKCLPAIKLNPQSSLKSIIPRSIAVGLFLIGIVIGTVYQSNYLFRDNPTSLCRKIYGANPFPESLKIAQFIENNTSTSDTIAVLGSEPQIYFYSRRHSATGHIYTYGLMETHMYSLAMQKEMAGEIEHAKPKLIIFVNIATSWLVRPQSEEFIFHWNRNYVDQHYKLVGIADIISPNETIYKWYGDTRSYHPTGPNLLVFMRKDQG